jgi:hypothetical protein
VQYSPDFTQLAQSLPSGCGVLVRLGLGVFSGVFVGGAKVA